APTREPPRRTRVATPGKSGSQADNILQRRLYVLMSPDAGGVDQELGPDPGPHALWAANPGGQRPQPPAEAGRAALAPLEGRPRPVQRAAEVAWHDRNAPQPVR